MNNEVTSPAFSEVAITSLLESIFQSPPLFLKQLTVTAAFHKIYVLSYQWTDIQQFLPTSSLRLPNDDTTEFQMILRIAGDHIPSIKTENEAATLTWLKTATNIPVPDLIAFDSTTANPLHHEYMILNRCKGVPISDIYNTLTADQLDNILLQLMDILIELHRHHFSQIGGFKLSTERNVVTGPMLDEHFWFISDIQQHFPTESFDSMNYHGPFETYTEYVSSATRSYLHVIGLHANLKARLEKFLPRISAFLDLLSLPEYTSILNKTTIWLAHKDLHFGNILYDPDTERVSAIIDWEFAGTIPCSEWDLVRAFLWNAQPGQESLDEKYRLRRRFAELCKENGVDFFADSEFTSVLQEGMHLVRNSLRGISTNVPKNLHPEAVEKWFEQLEKGLTAFGL